MKCPFCIKVCTKCKERIGEARLLVAYGGNFAKHKNGKYGFNNKCKECAKAYNQSDKGKESHAKARAKYEQSDKGKKTKAKYFQSDKGKKAQVKACTKYNKSDKGKKINAKASAKFRQNNPDRVKEMQAKYNKSDKRKRVQVKYYQNNPDIFFNNTNKRRSREENQGRGITKEQWLDMMNFFEWRCAYSGECLRRDNRSIDHIIPLIKGGLNEPWNCVPMIKSYNSSKKANDINEWYITQDFYSEERLNKIYEWQEYAYNKYYEE